MGDKNKKPKNIIGDVCVGLGVLLCVLGVILSIVGFNTPIYFFFVSGIFLIICGFFSLKFILNRKKKNNKQKHDYTTIINLSIVIIVILSISVFIAGCALDSVAMIFIAIFLFFGAVGIWGAKNNREIKKALESAQKIWEEQGLSMTKIYGDGLLYVLFVDYDKHKFAVDYSGNAYDISEIRGFNVYNNGILIWLKQDPPLPDPDIKIGTSGGYGKFSKEVIILTEYLVGMIGINKDEFYDKHKFSPTEEFWYRGQMFSYDVVSKQFCLFTSIGFEIFDFDAFVDLNIKKDSETANAFNWGGAVAGMLVGGGTGASYWAKDSKKICKDLELSIICADELWGETTTDYCLVSGCEVDESSEDYKAINCFIYNIKRACEIIEKRK